MLLLCWFWTSIWSSQTSNTVG